MFKAVNIIKLAPQIVILIIVSYFLLSFIRANLIVQKSEKELNPKKQSEEAHAKEYSLKEIDAKTSQIRWHLTAKGGNTQHKLQAALIKDVKVELYKNDKVIFTLSAPYAKADANTKEVYLFGDVVAKDNDNKLVLNSNQLVIGMGSSIQAEKGFNLILKNIGTIRGDKVVINDDQTKIVVNKLKEALLKDITAAGESVVIENDKNGNLLNVSISDGGKITLINPRNSSLSATKINWKNSGELKSTGNVTYTSENKIFKAGILLVSSDKKIYAENNVIVEHGQNKCYGDKLTYDNESQVVLSGKSRTIQDTKEIRADKIVYNLQSEKVEAIGNVMTYVKTD